MASLSRQIACFVRNPTVANVYATRGGNGTFGKHWDTHCVFAVQLIGAKRWRVFRPTLEWPLASQTSRSEKVAFDGEPVFDALLQPGDVLYVPRGWWHEVTPLQERPSLHAAIGVHSVKMHDYLRWVLNQRMTASKTHRQTLSLADVGVNDYRGACELLAAECEREGVFEHYRQECESLLGQKACIDFGRVFFPPTTERGDDAFDGQDGRHD